MLRRPSAPALSTALQMLEGCVRVLRSARRLGYQHLVASPSHSCDSGPEYHAPVDRVGQ